MPSSAQSPRRCSGRIKVYALIYSTPTSWGAQLYVDHGHITSFVSCGPTPAEAVRGVPPEDMVLAPRR